MMVEYYLSEEAQSKQYDEHNEQGDVHWMDGEVELAHLTQAYYEKYLRR